MNWQEIRAAIEQRFGTKDRRYEYYPSTYYRDLEAIQNEDRAWAQKEMADNFLSTYRTAIETIEEQERKLTVISEEADRPYDQIQARRAIIDAENLRINLILQGPIVLEYDRRLKEMFLAQAKQIIEIPKGLPTPIEEAPEEKEPPDVRRE